MISPTGDDFAAQVAELERYLDDLDRRTRSTFTVTNPATGVKNLEVGPAGTGYTVRLRDSNGNTIFGNRAQGIEGYRMPLPMYPSVPYSGYIYDSTSTFIDIWLTRTFVNSPSLNVTYRYGDLVPSGGTMEARVQYDLGAGRVTMPGSTVSAVNPVNATQTFTFTWPTDVFATEVTIAIQTRMASGAGQAAASPVSILGG